MVKETELRIRKFKGKVVHTAVRARIEALKPMMVEQETAIFTSLVNLEETIKPILHDAGIETFLFPFYLSYGRALWGKAQNFTGGTLNIEVQIIYEKWKARGLNATVLQSIASALGLVIPAP